MILLIQNNQLYNNDLRSMIMAFYPGVKIVEGIVDESQQAELQFCVKAMFHESKTELFLDEFEKSVKPIQMQDGSWLETRHLSITVEGNYEDKHIFRNKLKSGIYALLVAYTKRKLPWGDLTGVRPTKIAMAELNKGKTYDEVVDNYITTYHASHKKAELATKVADFEMKVIADIDKNNDYCLYVGIPFCPSRCLYCSFTSYPIGIYKDKAAEYIDKLCDELDYIADAYKDKRLVAIYVGGGTPTSIDHILMDKLLTKIEDTFELNTNPLRRKALKEFTVEAGRPDSITMDKLQVMKKHCITRISINPQTMNDETLRIIGRNHTANQTKEAFAMAREAGFDNINMDIIAGLPGENIDSMKHTLAEIEKLSPESITVHSLAIKRAAFLKEQLEDYSKDINHDMDAMLDMVQDVAGKLGMEPYYLYRQKNIGGNLENVGYAKKGLECLYNILIMEEITDIIAAGAGASTKLTFHDENRVERVENCKSVDDYIGRFDEMIDRKRKYF